MVCQSRCEARPTPVWPTTVEAAQIGLSQSERRSFRLVSRRRGRHVGAENPRRLRVQPRRHSAEQQRKPGARNKAIDKPGVARLSNGSAWPRKRESRRNERDPQYRYARPHNRTRKQAKDNHRSLLDPSAGRQSGEPGQLLARTLAREVGATALGLHTISGSACQGTAARRADRRCASCRRALRYPARSAFPARASGHSAASKSLRFGSTPSPTIPLCPVPA